MVPIPNSGDCVTEIYVTTLSRMMYRDHSPNKDNYAEYFHNLLYLEEYVSTRNLHQYNMKYVPVKTVNEKFLELEVSVTSYMSVCGTVNMRDVSGRIVTDLDLRMKACLGTVPLIRAIDLLCSLVSFPGLSTLNLPCLCFCR